jgi:predicted membrane protein
MGKIKAAAEIFFITILVMVAIIAAIFLAPLTIIIGITLLIWFILKVVQEDLADFKKESKDKEDDKPP